MTRPSGPARICARPFLTIHGAGLMYIVSPESGGNTTSYRWAKMDSREAPARMEISLRIDPPGRVSVAPLFAVRLGRFCLGLRLAGRSACITLRRLHASTRLALTARPLQRALAWS